MLKRLLSLLLIVSVLCGVVFIFPAAAQDLSAADPATAGVDGDVDVLAASSFGTLMKNTLENSADLESDTPCRILSADVDNTDAFVEFETDRNATLIVCVYSDNMREMYGEGSVAVTPEDTEAELEIDYYGSRSAYFCVIAYLVDTYSFAPLCQSFVNSTHTMEVENLIASSIYSYDSDRVLNLDSDPYTNFAVFKKDIVVMHADTGEPVPTGAGHQTPTVIEDSDGKNIVVSADESSLTYTFDNIDSRIANLQSGDTLAYYVDEKNLLIVNVKNISVTGTRAVIVGNEMDLEDVFEIVKVEGVSDGSNVYHSYDGTLPAVGAQQTEGDKSDLAPTGEISLEDSVEFNLPITLKSDDEADMKYCGGLDLSLKFLLKVYITSKERYIEAKIDYTGKVSLSLSAELPLKCPLGYFFFSPCLGCFIEFTPSFKITLKGEVELSGTLSGTLGIQFTSENGARDISKKTKFTLENELKVEVTLEMGISLEPKITLLGSLVEIGANAFIGTRVVATISEKVEMIHRPAEVHECDMCIDGEIHVIFNFGFDIDFSKKLQKFIDDHSKSGRFKKVGDHVVPLSVEFKPLDVKLTDFYYSFDFSEFDFTECPHKLYRLRAIVTKESGEISGLTVDVDGSPCEIDDGHIGVIYLRNGEYHVKASTNDDYYCSRDITIDKAALDVDMPLKKEPFYKVSMGAASCAAITEADKLYVWGSNKKHQLGLTGIESTSTPQFLMEDVRDVCVGNYYGLALKKNGDVYMWGTGNLAYNSSVIVHETPYKVLSGVKSITCASDFRCAAIKDNDDLYVWGSSSSQSLFNGNPKDVTSFTCVLHNIRDFAFGGSAFSAYIDTNDNMYMIGSNSWGQIGDGKGKLGNTRTSKYKVMTNVKSMSLGYAHSACITKDGKLYMWGRGSNGEFGNGTTTSRVLKPNVMIWKNLKSVKLGYDMSAVIDEDNYMHVTGRNTYGQLGDYTTNDSTVWEMFLPNVRTMSTANVGHSTAAITYDGDLYTCGYNMDGQLGYSTNAGTQNDNPEPQKVILHPSGGGRSVPVSTAAEPEVNRQTHFEGLTPNKLYNFYSMRSKTAEKPFSRYNVWYMAQLRADDNGVIDVDFYQDSTVDVVNFVVAIDYSVGRFVLGDADGNGDVDINDATWVRRYAALIGTPFEPDTLMRGDVDQNNLLEIIDATLIQKKLAEMDTAYAA